jgi:polyisoprenoid-binding protein YceI
MALVAATACAALLSCALPERDAVTATPSPGIAGSAPVAREETLAAQYATLSANEGKVFAFDPAMSEVRIYVFRAGRAAKLGHNHVLSAPSFHAFAYVPPDPAATRFDLEFRLDELEIDNPSYRGALGSAYASPLSAEAIEGTRDHMLGSDNMQADRHPWVRVRSLRVIGEGPKVAAEVEVEVHGQRRPMWVPLGVELSADRLAVSGSMVIRQTDFGAKPYSVLGGLIAVQDELVVEFRLKSGGTA